MIHKCRKLSDREGSFDVKAYPANNGSFTTCKKTLAGRFLILCGKKRNKYAKIPAGRGTRCEGSFANDVNMPRGLRKEVAWIPSIM